MEFIVCQKPHICWVNTTCCRLWLAVFDNKKRE